MGQVTKIMLPYVLVGVVLFVVPVLCISFFLLRLGYEQEFSVVVSELVGMITSFSWCAIKFSVTRKRVLIEQKKRYVNGRPETRHIDETDWGVPIFVFAMMIIVLYSIVSFL